MNFRYQGLDFSEPTTRDFYSEVQGNILHGHGRDRSALIVVNFHQALAKEHPFRTWLRSFNVVNASEQDAAAQSSRKSRTGPASFFQTVYLTATGYARLGFSPSQMPGDLAFRQGSRARARLIGDGKYSEWEAWATGPVGMAILIAHDSEEHLDQAVTDLIGEIDSHAPKVSVAGCLRGSSLRQDGMVKEPFGFADGISDPLFVRRHLDNFQKVNASFAWDPSADPKHLVLAPEISHSGGWGSYLVVRKLTQDLAGFEAATTKLSEKLDVEKSLAAAFVVGRHKDGTPVVSHEFPTGDADNSFTFEDDDTGRRCPLQAHTRRMNPRTKDPEDLSRRISRRGFSYIDENGTGLVFMCFQQDISRQFEFLQKIWANGVGSDPVADPLISSSADLLNWPISWNARPNERRSFSFPKTVELAGTLYLFAPSIKLLRNI